MMNTCDLVLLFFFVTSKYQCPRLCTNLGKSNIEYSLVLKWGVCSYKQPIGFKISCIHSVRWRTLLWCAILCLFTLLRFTFYSRVSRYFMTAIDNSSIVTLGIRLPSVVLMFRRIERMVNSITVKTEKWKHEAEQFAHTVFNVITDR